MKIPEPRKLNSGSYFIQLRLNGVSVPVTASTAKECKRQAALIKAEYQAGKRKVSKEDLTPGQMIENFIAKYERVLSPATIRTYDKARRLRFKNYMDKPYKDIKDWQAMINDELKIVSNKTVRTNWGAVTTALSDIGYSIPKVKFEPLKENDLSFLEPEEIPLFLKAAEGDSAEIEMLLELHSLRISEALYVVRHDMIDLKHNASCGSTQRISEQRQAYPDPRREYNSVSRSQNLRPCRCDRCDKPRSAPDLRQSRV